MANQKRHTLLMDKITVHRTEEVVLLREISDVNCRCCFVFLRMGVEVVLQLFCIGKCQVSVLFSAFLLPLYLPTHWPILFLSNPLLHTELKIKIITKIQFNYGLKSDAYKDSISP